MKSSPKISRESTDEESTLQQVNDWIERHLDLNGDNNSAQSTQRFQEQFLAIKMKELAKYLGIKPQLITIRTQYSRRRNFLRPTYSHPNEIYNYFAQSNNQIPFEFQNEPFADTGEELRLGSVPFTADKSRELTGAVYDISRLDEESAGTPAGFRYKPRIRRFFENLPRKHPNTAALIRRLRKRASFCLIVGVVGRVPETGEKRFEHFLAIYWHAEQCFDLAEKRPRLIEFARAVFHGTELIHRFDAALFRNEGLRLVSELSGRFAQPDIPPADKISYLLEKLRRLLCNHLIASDGQVAEGESPTPDVYFVATQFIRPHDRTRNFLPRFQVYPLCYSQSENKSDREASKPARAFLIHHDRIPSAAKFLINYYFSKKQVTTPGLNGQRAELSKEFKSIFATGLTRRAEQTGALDKELVDQIRLAPDSVDRGKSVWDDLSLPQLPGQPVRDSVAAFVVEGGVAGNSTRGTAHNLPLGVLVIEGLAHDSFSDADIQSLRSVASGMAPLVRMVSHPNASINYEHAIAKTFEEDTQAEVTQALAMRDFLFNSIRLDAEEYFRIVDYFGRHISTTSDDGTKVDTGLGSFIRRYAEIEADLLERIQRAHACVLIPSTDEDTLRETPEPRLASVVNRFLRARREAFLRNQTELKLAYQRNPGAIFNFLAACPPNYVWFGYLRSIPQALGDRAVTVDPTFHRIGPGFSADALFMATIDGELRQVVKLSTWEKLDQERKKYRDFVRYKVPFAARISSTAYAVESRGRSGIADAAKGHYSDLVPDEPSDDTFGALVSDLVDGAKDVSGFSETSSFLDIASKLFKRELQNSSARPSATHDSVSLKAEVVLSALADHFTVGVSLWRRIPNEQLAALSEDWRRRTAAAFVASCFRLRELQELRGSTTKVAIALQSLNEAQQRSAASVLRVLFNIFGENKQSPELTAILENEHSEITQVIAAVGEIAHNPVKTFDIGRPDLDGLITIMHGDMNARNLTWADAFRRFFIIDFEHVGYGLIGIDQFRLIMSLLSDIWSASAGRGRSVVKQNAEIGNRIYTIIRHFDRTLDSFTQDSYVADVASEIETDSHEQNKIRHDFVIQAIGKILSTISGGNTPTEGTINQIQGATPRFWPFVAFCAGVKEFEYSCRNLSADLVNFMMRAADKSDLFRQPNLGEFLAALQQDDEVVDDELRRIAARFVLSFCCLCATLPSSG